MTTLNNYIEQVMVEENKDKLEVRIERRIQTDRLPSNLRLLFKMQEKMNETVNPEWRQKGYRWSDAAFLEATEAFNYTNWPWWKKIETNWKELQVELIDVLHFMVSEYIERSGLSYNEVPASTYRSLAVEWSTSYENYVMYVHEDKKTPEFRSDQLRIHLRSFISAIAEGKKPLSSWNNFHLLFLMMTISGLTPGDGVNLYVGKNVLNQFRQKNGYKKGEYIKFWPEAKGQENPPEDNVWLNRFLGDYAGEPDGLPDYLLDCLTKQYEKVKGY